MSKRKRIVTSELGIPLPETVARHVDGLLKTLPKECTYRKASALASTEFVHGEKADISLVSSKSLDRENEVVLPDGIDLRQFQANPVVTFAHKYDELPIGKAQWVKRVDGGIKAKTVYAQKPEGWSGDWFADAVFALVQQGILKGKSIGFLPTKMRAPTKEEVKADPTWQKASAVIEECVMLEYAIAPVPVNQDALVEAVSKGFKADPRLLTALGLKAAKAKPAKVYTDAEVFHLVLERLAKVSIDMDAVIDKALANLQGRGRV